jgi:hypothetical protein
MYSTYIITLCRSSRGNIAKQTQYSGFFTIVLIGFKLLQKTGDEEKL